MRVACIGNSHLGCLKRGWDKFQPFRQVELTFFGQRALGLDDLIVAEGALIPGSVELAEAMRFTSGGKGKIDPEEYEVFLLFGMWCPAYICPPVAGYSKRALHQAVVDILEPTLFYRTAEKLRQVTEKRIFVGHSPLPAAAVGKRDLLSVEEQEAYRFGLGVLNAYLEQTLQAVVLPQPEQTLAAGHQTFCEFKRGSRRLNVGAPNDDELHGLNDPQHHMNADFGELVLQQFFEKLGLTL